MNKNESPFIIWFSEMDIGDVPKVGGKNDSLGEMPVLETEIMLNLATPESAFKWWRLPVNGVGLARMEFIISNHIKIHPMTLVHPEHIEDEEVYRKIRKLTRGYTDLKEYFIDRLASGIAKIAASRYPDPGVVLYFAVVGLSGIYALLSIHWSFVAAALLALIFTRHILTTRYVPVVTNTSEAL